ncbi:MAG: RagB/SusD family nutrient uptake outer membrane protein [Prolixibacteraceae bacterium]|jgi:hypothetical protein|nr:RagB/SusD family nutrient uptake outer membrane protein [Prolixibacteraceae bacterium]
MKTKNLIIILVILASVNITCSDFLEEDPKSILSPTSYPNSEADVRQIFGGVHSIIVGLTNARWHIIVTGSDEGISRMLPGESRGDLDHYAFQIDNGFFLDIWQSEYQVINSMNLIIDRLESLDENWVNPYIGAAQALRAFMYFDLVRLFGKIPLIVIPSSEIALFEVEREEISVVYDQIILDLTNAETNLSGHQWDIPIMPTIGFAKSMLAKVYMTMAGNPLNDATKWALASSKAKEVVDLNIYQLVKPYSDLFLIANENGPEHIFSAQISVDGPNRQLLNLNFRPRNIGLQRGNGQAATTIQFYQEFSADDIRRDVSILTGVLSTTGNSGGAPKTYTYPTWGGSAKERTPHIKKYFDTNRPYENWMEFDRSSGNNFPILRFADVLLTLAESENEANGPTDLAYNALNQIRDRAGLSPLSGLSQSEFRNAVRDDRKKELCFEAHRRFDLVRWGTFFSVMSADPYAGPNVKPHHELLPIPLLELNVNPGLGQNPNY